MVPNDFEIAHLVEIKPNRDGTFSLDSREDARAVLDGFKADPTKFDGGDQEVGIATVLANRWKVGANARGWKRNSSKGKKKAAT